MQGLNLSVADLLGRPGEYRDFTISSVVTGVSNPLAQVEDRPVAGDMRAESVVEGILVTGSFWASVSYQCARCLARFGVPVSLEVCELFVAPGHEAGSDDDTYRVVGKEVRLEPMLRDALALSLPLSPICRESCAGLCSGCGRNLNEDTCVCSEQDVDPRWADLAVLRERLQG